MITLNPTLRIIRLEETIQGTFGILLINSQIFCATLEPTDLSNKSFVSCIPAQQYQCVLCQSPRFGSTYKIINVPDRTKILFHKGNTTKDTAGCIIVGQYHDKLKEERILRNSGNTFKEFMKALKGIKECNLTIKECY